MPQKSTVTINDAMLAQKRALPSYIEDQAVTWTFALQVGLSELTRRQDAERGEPAEVDHTMNYKYSECPDCVHSNTLICNSCTEADCFQKRG